MHYTSSICFFFNDTATTEIYTLSLHDALPICDAPGVGVEHRHDRHRDVLDAQAEGVGRHDAHGVQERRAVRVDDALGVAGGADRKSTRLNSSHANISYAVFCLKKKTTFSIFQS